MSKPTEPVVDAEVLGERRHLIALAFRMLGTTAEAEDAVQETYARWYRMSQAERDAIEVPRAWLTRVASRVCLDLLSSARARHERYVGPWLPEPVPTAGPPGHDPLEQVTLDDSVSTALLLVLESMTPAERVSFVLHDVFAVPFTEVAGIVGRTPAAAATGDLPTLVAVLDPDVVVRSDGGGRVRAARNPVRGSGRVGRFLLGILRLRTSTEVLEQETNDGLGFALWDEGRITGIITFEVSAGLVTEVRMVLNPDKLSLWH